MKGENPSGDRQDRQQTIEVVERNWRAEVETAEVYRDLAERERDAKRKGVLLRMAEAEERHAQRWEKKLIDLGTEPPVLKNTIARRLNRWWNKIAGAEIAIRRMEAAEERREGWIGRGVRNCFGRRRRDEQPATLHSYFRPRGNACFHAVDGRGRLSCRKERSGSL